MFGQFCQSQFLIKFFFVQWIFLLISSVLNYLYIGDLIQGLINSQLVVSPESDIYTLWKDPPVNPEMKIYLFNVTNVEEWLNGTNKKLRVQQVGPFVYKETWMKENITFHNQNGSVSYYMFKKFKYLEDISLSEDLQVIVPNIPLFSAAASMKNANAWSLMGFSATLNMLDADAKQLFIKKTAKEFIWGYDDTLSTFASLVMPPEEIGIPGKFGLFAGKNMTPGGLFTVDTGAKNLKDLSQTVKYRGQTHFKSWRSKACNKVRGADGSFFPPWISKYDTLDIFVPDLCTSLPITTDGEEIIFHPGSVKTFRFRPHPNTFNYDNQENKCFCSGPSEDNSIEEPDDILTEDNWFTGSRQKRASESACPDFGVFDMAPCKFGAPLYVSWPHFYNAHPKFAAALEGLEHPSEAAHGLRMDIQPVMGLGLSANVRLQMNLKIEPNQILNKLGGVPLRPDESLLLPIMWFDDTIERPPTHLLILLGDALSTGDNISKGVLIFSSVTLLLQIVLCISYISWRKFSVGNNFESDKSFGQEEETSH